MKTEDEQPISNDAIDFDFPEQVKTSQDELKRLFDENKNRHRHKLFIIALWVVFLSAMLLLFTRILHLIFPDDWRWLTHEDLQSMDKLLFSGTIGSILGKYGGSLFSDKK